MAGISIPGSSASGERTSRNRRMHRAAPPRKNAAAKRTCSRYPGWMKRETGLYSPVGCLAASSDRNAVSRKKARENTYTIRAVAANTRIRAKISFFPMRISRS